MAITLIPSERRVITLTLLVVYTLIGIKGTHYAHDAAITCTPTRFEQGNLYFIAVLVGNSTKQKQTFSANAAICVALTARGVVRITFIRVAGSQRE